jgi:dUTP pyrophosphatase
MIIRYMLDEGAYAPEKAHFDDAGFDIRLPDRKPDEPAYVNVPAHGSAVIDTGVHMAIPHGYVGFLKSKSGLNVKHSLSGEGVVDAGYQGSIVVKLYNNGDEDYPFGGGEKLIQIVILPIPDVEMEQVDSFDESTARGNNGFGSTGR